MDDINITHLMLFMILVAVICSLILIRSDISAINETLQLIIMEIK